MARPAITSKAAFITQALSFIDRNGVDELSLRNLGKAMNISHATLYRHFASKEELLNAVIDDQLGAAIQGTRLDIPAKDRLRELALELRKHFNAHPNLIRPFINGTGAGENAFRITSLTVEALGELGIPQSKVSHWLRILENFVLGSMAYDFAAAPNHLKIRASRLNILTEAGYFSERFKVKDVDSQNQAAFEEALSLLLDAAQSQGQNAIPN